MTLDGGSGIGGATSEWRPQISRFTGVALITPLLVLLGVVFVFPLAKLVWISISQPRFGIEHFRDFIHNPASINALETTFRVSASVTAIALVVGTVIAWELRTTRSRLKKWILWCAVLFPLWMGLVVRNFAFTILLEPQGVVNKTLMRLHLIDQPLTILYTSKAVTIGILYALLPYAVLPLYATFVNIDLSLVQAAESLGASRLRALASIVFPLSIASILASGAIVFVLSAGFYITPLLLGGPTSPFLATLISEDIFATYNVPEAASIGVILIVLALSVVIVAWRVVGLQRLQRAVA
jgi:ABC-type spermidine/putrescine transport system permease subunit I